MRNCSCTCEQPIYKANDDYMGEEGDSPKPSMSDYIVCTKLRLRFRYPERSVCTCSTERPSGKRVPKKLMFRSATHCGCKQGSSRSVSSGSCSLSSGSCQAEVSLDHLTISCTRNRIVISKKLISYHQLPTEWLWSHQCYSLPRATTELIAQM